MATISHQHIEIAESRTKEIYKNIMRTYGVSEPHGIYQLMGHTPEHLAASWPRSRYLFGNDSMFSLKDKHILTLAISATNNCEYCVRIHTDRLWQLGITTDDLVETLMVVDVVNGYDKFAEGTRAGDDPTIPYLNDGDANDTAEQVFEEVRNLHGDKEPDVIYAQMGYQPDYLRASWERSKLCFEEEGMGLKLKHMIAFCVAATNSNDYFVKVHTNRLKELGLTDEELVELLLVVDLTAGYNRYVQGLLVEMETEKFGEDAEANRASSMSS